MREDRMSLKKIVCTSCENKIEKAELSGKRLIKNQLIDYYLCKLCVKQVPNVSFHTTKKTNDRQNFWEGLEKKMAAQTA